MYVYIKEYIYMQRISDTGSTGIVLFRTMPYNHAWLVMFPLHIYCPNCTAGVSRLVSFRPVIASLHSFHNFRSAEMMWFNLCHTVLKLSYPRKVCEIMSCDMVVCRVLWLRGWDLPPETCQLFVNQPEGIDLGVAEVFSEEILDYDAASLRI